LSCSTASSRIAESIVTSARDDWRRQSLRLEGEALSLIKLRLDRWITHPRTASRPPR
jgi:hypothetical protein